MYQFIPLIAQWLMPHKFIEVHDHIGEQAVFLLLGDFSGPLAQHTIISLTVSSDPVSKINELTSGETEC